MDFSFLKYIESVLYPVQLTALYKLLKSNQKWRIKKWLQFIVQLITIKLIISFNWVFLPILFKFRFRI